MPPEREAACTDHVIPGSPEQFSAQLREQETVGREWGGGDPGNPTGLNRSPTFSSYGWNPAVAGQLTPPTLVIQGLDDTAVPAAAANASATFNALPASMTNKVLLRVQCASHAIKYEAARARAAPRHPGRPTAGALANPGLAPMPRSRQH
jgi:pimeloyl-ACP methyl ester carboxylesterase